jgi:hypothetical protein
VIVEREVLMDVEDAALHPFTVDPVDRLAAGRIAPGHADRRRERGRRKGENKSKT